MTLTYPSFPYNTLGVFAEVYSPRLSRNPQIPTRAASILLFKGHSDTVWKLANKVINLSP